MLPLLAMVIVVLSAIGGILYWWLRPDPRIALIMAIAAMFGTGVFAFVMSQSSRQSEFEASMQRDGLRGVATIVRAESTNLLVNKRPQVNLLLRVELPDRPAYEQGVAELVPFGQSAMPGRKLRVYVDAKDRTRLLLDWASAPPDQGNAEMHAPVSGNLADRLSELEDARKKGLITEAEYRQQRERLLSKF